MTTSTQTLQHVEEMGFCANMRLKYNADDSECKEVMLFYWRCCAAIFAKSASTYNLHDERDGRPLKKRQV